MPGNVLTDVCPKVDTSVNFRGTRPGRASASASIAGRVPRKWVVSPEKLALACGSCAPKCLHLRASIQRMHTGNPIWAHSTQAHEEEEKSSRVCDTRPSTFDGVRLRVGRSAARAGDAQGTPTQSQISPNILVYEDYHSRNPRQQAAVTESGPPRAIHLRRHKWPEGLVN